MNGRQKEKKISKNKERKKERRKERMKERSKERRRRKINKFREEQEKGKENLKGRWIER